MTAADLAQSISRELPFLRRYARALTGSQTAGDNYAAATLEAILSDRSLMAGEETRIALFRTFHAIWQSSGQPVETGAATPREARVQAHLRSLTPNSREALLLRTIEELRYDQIAAVMQCPQSEAEQLVQIALKGEFGGMHPDDHKALGRKLVMPRRQIGQGRDTVRTAKGPEIDQHQLVAQPGHGQLGRVDPVGKPGEFGGRIAPPRPRRADQGRALFEPKASSAPGTMILADSRSLSSIRRRSPARTDVTSPAYVRSTIPAYAPSTLRTLLPCTEKDGHPKKRDSRPFLTHHT